MRPGHLKSYPVRQTNNPLRRTVGPGLGGFGKGAMVPPPSAVPVGPAIFEEGEWVCQGPEPQAEVDGYWSCCPSGWKKAPFGEMRPCKGEDNLLTCGSIPDGLDISQVKCCVDRREWISVNDTCGLLPGKEGPIRAEDILASDLEFEREPVVTPKMLIAGGFVAVTLIGLAILAR